MRLLEIDGWLTQTDTHPETGVREDPDVETMKEAPRETNSHSGPRT